MRQKIGGGWDKRYKNRRSSIQPPTWRLLICLFFWLGIPVLLFQIFPSLLDGIEWVLIFIFVFLILLTPKRLIYGKEMAALHDEFESRLKEIKERTNS